MFIAHVQRVDVCSNHRRALVFQPIRRRLSDPGCGPGDERGLSLKASWHNGLYDSESSLVRILSHCALVAFSASLASAQTIIDPNLNTWFSYFGEHPISSTRFSLVTHGHIRRNRFLAEPQQLIARFGLYHNPNAKFTYGGGYVISHGYRFPDYAGPYAADEQRIWQDFTLRSTVGKVMLTNRVRLEQRFLADKAGPPPGHVIGHHFENRFRHLARITFPIGRGYGLSLGNELWLPYAPEQHARRVEQNRPQISIGKRIHKYWRVEAMYMLQQIWQPSGLVRQDNHTVWLQIYCDVPVFGRR